MRFLFAVELYFIILRGGFESRGGGNLMRGGEGLLEEGLPVYTSLAGAFDAG